MPATPPPIKLPDKLQAALTADPKRTWLLVGLVVVLLVICLRAMRTGPASAAASLFPSTVSVDVQNSTVATANRTRSSNALIDWLAQPKPVEKRNLFALHLDGYAKDPRGPIGPAESDSSDETAKSGTPQADQNRGQDTLVKQAAKLKLQSTFLGPSPMALVNGQLVREGDTVGQFQVVRIEPRRIAIRQNGITLQISMD